MKEQKLPKIGLGTWQLKPDEAKKSTIEAIKMGYRFIDTAQAYKNEQGIGDGVKEILETTNTKRNQLIIATKIFVFNLCKRRVFKTFAKSIKKLQLDYVDILYVHWPAFWFGYNHKKTLAAFSKLVDNGQVKHIGVSNFTPKLIEEAKQVCDKPIFVNQVEHHPLLRQKKLREYLNKNNIHLVAYSPLARGKVFSIPELNDIAKKYAVSEAQVSLSWIIDHGAIPIPKATSVAHIKDNYEALNLTLDKQDIEKINNINREKRLLNPPIIKPKW
ncbi:MAG: aldo/keto reductase [Candidatus Lokiarchaeota archaeon]|nr:aldo/keto reductase [Candidatus Lokiarchaeota archaeon]